MGFWAELDSSGREVRSGETYTCCHCGIPFAVPPPGVERYRCRKCDSSGRVSHGAGWVCAGCNRHGRCTPWERRMDKFEKRVNEQLSREAFVKSMGV